MITDDNILIFFNVHLRHPWLDSIMPLLSEAWFLYGLYLVLIIILCLLNFRSGRPALKLGLVLTLLVALGAGLADYSGNALKDLILRERPYSTLAAINYYDDETNAWRVLAGGDAPYRRDSMPSNHAATNMAAATVLALANRPLRPWIFILPLLVGWSRLYLARHYPSDVLAGFILGLLCAALLWPACRRTRNWAGKRPPA